jgi:hypothetical protein
MLGFPKKDMPNPDDPSDCNNYDDMFMSVAAAKALLIDLRDAVDAITMGTMHE